MVGKTEEKSRKEHKKDMRDMLQKSCTIGVPRGRRERI